MKSALTLYEELKDRLDYTLSSWIRLEMNQEEETQSRTILASASFLFDNLFAKEDAGKDLTQEVRLDQGKHFFSSALAEKAALLRVHMSSEVFEDGQSPLRDYLRWVKESEADVKTWNADNYGKLCIVTIEELVNLLTARPTGCEPLRVAELLFLNITETFAFAYKELLGPRFLSQKSAPYFVSVSEAMENIRGEIRD